MLVKWLGERRIVPSGPPFIRVREIDAGGEALKLEVAVPVAAEVFADGDVHAGTLPAGCPVTMRRVGSRRLLVAE